MWRILVIASLLLLAGSAAVARPATPDAARCAQAASPAERLICGDARLLRADTEMAQAYGRLIAHAAPAARPAIRADQRAWLVERDACGDAACVRSRYETRSAALYAQLDRRDRVLRRAVARVGQCAVTTIDLIGPRLESADPAAPLDRPDASGTTVLLANGVHQVSYDLVGAAARSRVGDAARVCLVSIPAHCPPGDDRGRWYAVTNARTGERWKMPDSEHACGGA